MNVDEGIVIVIVMFLLLILEAFLIHWVLYLLINKFKWKIPFGFKLYVTGVISVIASYVIDYYTLLSIGDKWSEGLMMGLWMFLYLSLFIMPVTYLVGLSVFLII